MRAVYRGENAKSRPDPFMTLEVRIPAPARASLHVMPSRRPRGTVAFPTESGCFLSARTSSILGKERFEVLDLPDLNHEFFLLWC
jgi:hypothetical protein